LGKIKDKLLMILRTLDGKGFRTGGACFLRWKGRVLDDSETLADAGAFDGARLTVEEER
jgi:hypothetical protein